MAQNRASEADKENAAPQRQRASSALAQQAKNVLDTSGREATSTTPETVARPPLETTPESLLAPLALCNQPLVQDGKVSQVKPQCDCNFTKRSCEAANGSAHSPTVSASAEESLPLKGVNGLSDLNFCNGEVPVKNTFISFSTTSPATQKASKRLCGDSEPRDFAPGPFELFEEEPVVISLQDSLEPLAPNLGRGSRRIQLNLNVWIPPVPKLDKLKAVSEAPVIRLTSHHFPLAARAPVMPYPVGAISSSFVQLPATAGEGDPVCRRLFDMDDVL